MVFAKSSREKKIRVSRIGGEGQSGVGEVRLGERVACWSARSECFVFWFLKLGEKKRKKRRVEERRGRERREMETMGEMGRLQGWHAAAMRLRIRGGASKASTAEIICIQWLSSVVVSCVIKRVTVIPPRVRGEVAAGLFRGIECGCFKGESGKE
ncbi:hypothetical protein Droror1_Dr00006785 [Drosera rotundifolia]